MPRIHLDADPAHQHFFMIYWFFNKSKNFQTFVFLLKLSDLLKNLKFLLIQYYLTILNSVVLCDMLFLRSGSVKPTFCGYNWSGSVALSLRFPGCFLKIVDDLRWNNENKNKTCKCVRLSGLWVTLELSTHET